jgi:hypothetical protein
MSWGLAMTWLGYGEQVYQNEDKRTVFAAQAQAAECEA